MDTRVLVTFDGTSFQPAAPLPPDLKPGDTGVVVLANGKLSAPIGEGPQLGQPGSFLKAVAECQIEGPPDWSTNLHKYPVHGPD